MDSLRLRCGCFVVFGFSLVVSAQTVTESYSPGSTVPSPFGPADIVVVASSRSAPASGNPNGTIWTRANLGVPPGGNVDAFSDGTDVFPPFGPTCNPGVSCRYLVIEYTVTPGTLGIPGTVIRTQATGNGAASDTFAVRASVLGALSAPALVTDALGVPTTTDLDALCWYNNKEFPFYPVFYSIDAPTAALMTAAYAPAVYTEGDIIAQFAAGGMPFVFLSRSFMGLVPGDDIDALAVNFPTGNLVFSLSLSSPTANGGLAGCGTGSVPIRPGGLYLFAAPGVFREFANDVSLGMGGPMGGSSDDLNGVRITDPAGDFPGPGLPGGAGYQGLPIGTFSAILFDGIDGGNRRIVDFRVGQPIPFSISGPPTTPPGSVITITATLGIPCQAQVFPTFIGNLALLNLANLIAFPVPFATLFPAGLPTPAQLTLQGVMPDAAYPSGLAITNAITLNVF